VSWTGQIMANRNATGADLVALAERLAADPTAPPSLRELATAYGETRLYRADRPRARSSDPETSQQGAKVVRGRVRPGGSVHRILRAYARNAAASHPAAPESIGYTSREVESAAIVRAAHKRTSELLADGLLRVVTSADLGEAWLDDGHPSGEPLRELLRGGGRVLTITPDGRVELARLDAAESARA
jgi:hypothetical protein